MRWRRIILITIIVLSIGGISLRIAYSNNDGVRTIVNGLMNADQQATSPPVTEEPEGQEMLVDTYTPSSETHCSRGLCTLTLYSGTRYINEDSEWKTIENARSWNGYFDKVYIEDDRDNYDLNIIDMNNSYIHFNLTIDDSLVGQQIPIKRCKISDNICNQIMLLFTKSFYDVELTTINNPLDYNFTLGANSTTVILQTANTENLEDTYVSESSASTNYGSATGIYIRDGGGYDYWTYIKFNLSLIPSGNTIVRAELVLRSYDADATPSIGWIHEFDNQTWTETDFNWNTKPANGTQINSTTLTTTDAIWVFWDATDWVASEYNSGHANVSFVVREAGNSLRWYFYSKEYTTTSLRPYITITYVPEGESYYDYIFGSVTSHHIYEENGMSDPLASGECFGGSQIAAGDYEYVKLDDANYLSIPDYGSNFNPCFRFNFTIDEDEDTIDWMYFHINGYGTYGGGEDVNCYIYDFDNTSWVQYCDDMPTSDGDCDVNITTDMAQFVDSNSQVVGACAGKNLDVVGDIRIDYVSLQIAYTEGGEDDATFSIAMPDDYSWTAIEGTVEGSATATSTITCNFTEASENWIEPSVEGDFSKNQSGIGQPIFFINNTGSGAEDIAIRVTGLPLGANITANSTVTGTGSGQATATNLTTTYQDFATGLGVGSKLNVTLWCGINKEVEPGQSSEIVIYIRSTI